MHPVTGVASQEGDAPDGITVFIVRAQQRFKFKFEAECLVGKAAGKILSTKYMDYISTPHTLWSNATSGGYWEEGLKPGE